MHSWARQYCSLSRVVPWDALCSFIERYDGLSMQQSLQASNMQLDPDTQIALKLMHNKCARLPVSRGSKLHYMFSYFDPNKTGTVSSTNFKQAFQMLKLKIEENQLNFLSKSLDPTGSGIINYRDFMHFFKDQGSVYRPVSDN
eukprot:39933-Pyramimonas_sp.AAC.1